jgi:succinate dehydrogenase / fumarate reductase flavoprotein subunit
LQEAIGQVRQLRHEFWQDVKIVGTGEELNQSLEHAGRVADFFELADLMCRDALVRDESCGTHFRVEHQTEGGEPLRNDEQFSFVSAWQFTGPDSEPVLHREPLEFQNIAVTRRTYA